MRRDWEGGGQAPEALGIWCSFASGELHLTLQSLC